MADEEPVQVIISKAHYERLLKQIEEIEKAKKDVTERAFCVWDSIIDLMREWPNTRTGDVVALMEKRRSDVKQIVERRFNG